MHAFLKAGHLTTLQCAFWYFGISSMVWVLFGPLANAIVPDCALSDRQRWFLVAVPLLGGALARLPFGLLTDRVGARRAGLAGLLLTLLPLLLGWLWAESFAQLLCVGLMLGVAGASFAAALPLAGRWYPPQFQGVALGIVGAGNCGTALATFFGPALADAYGWRMVFGLAMAPVLLILLLFLLLARDSPVRPPPRPLRAYAAVLGSADAWWFCFFYAVTFGGFVGFASFLNSFFKMQFGISDMQAGLFTTLCVLSGSMLRPVGGYLADRHGGIRVLLWFSGGSALALLVMSALPPAILAAVSMFLCLGLLGMGNGAIFQLVPQRFPQDIGVLTGIVGAAGGLGGFMLPLALGGLRESTGSFAFGFLVYGGLSLLSVAALWHVSRAWQGTFVDRGGRALRPEVRNGYETESPAVSVKPCESLPPAVSQGLTPQASS